MKYCYRTINLGNCFVKIASTEDGVVVGERWCNKKGEIHRRCGLPAMVHNNGIEEYYIGGVYQRTEVVTPPTSSYTTMDPTVKGLGK